MSANCNCLSCQMQGLIAAEVERRRDKVEAAEVLKVATDLIAMALYGMSPPERAAASLEAGMAVAIKLRQMDAQTVTPQPTHQPEARVQ